MIKSKLPEKLYTNSKSGKRGKAELTSTLCLRANAKLLQEIDKFCKENNIPKSNLYRYCLEAGFSILQKNKENARE